MLFYHLANTFSVFTYMILKKRDFLLTPCYNGCVDTKHLCCAGGKGDLRGMEETERRTESITVRLISKEQFCKIMDAIHEQDKLMDSICKSLERIADIFSFDVDNKYRKALEDFLCKF